MTVPFSPDVRVVIEGVVGDGVSEPLEMNTDLMGSSSFGLSENDGGIGLRVVSQALKDG